MGRWLWVVALLGGAAVAQTPAPAAPEEQVETIPIVYPEVLEVNEGKVTLGAGTAQGYAFGKTVRIFRRLEAPDPNNPEATHELMAVVQIERATETESYAPLGRGETARPGDQVDLTMERPTASLATPRRPDYTYAVAVSVRPLLGGPDGFGVLFGGSLVYRIPSLPWFTLNASLDPISVGLGVPFAGRLAATFAWSLTYFELGVGLGVMPGQCYGQGCGASPIITFNSTVRLGTPDGASIAVGMGNALAGYYASGIPVLFTADATLAFTRELGMFGKAVFGATLEQTGIVGVRLYTQGGGERGSIIYSVAGGVSNIALGGSYAGFSLSFGAEFRL